MGRWWGSCVCPFDLPGELEYHTAQEGSMSFNPRYLLLILAIAVSIYLAVDFGKRLETLALLSQKERHLEAQVQNEAARQDELKASLKEIMMPAFAERIARQVYRWARDGDTIAATTKIAAPAPPPPAAAAPPAPRREWWQAIFDFLFGP